MTAHVSAGMRPLAPDLTHFLAPCIEQEWTASNHVGGYASLSATGCPTRRQHGLLVAAAGDVRHRMVFLSRLEEVLIASDCAMQLNSSHYPGAPAPMHHPHLREVFIYPNPTFVYEWRGITITREVIATATPSVLVRYSFSGAITQPLTLHLRPLTPFRGADQLTFENIHLRPHVERLSATQIRVAPYDGVPAMTMGVWPDPVEFTADPVWYRKISYAHDERRGYEHLEDQFSFGYFEASITGPCQLTFEASVPLSVPRQQELGESEFGSRERASGRGHASTHHELRDALHAASDLYFYEAPGNRVGILAGFPWFAEWGRDTFISLPGLTLARGQLDRCREVLEGVLPYLRGGLLPNIFGATPDSSKYNSIDAALWFARAVDLYDHALGRRSDTARHFLPALLTIALSYRAGISTLQVTCDAAGMLHLNNPSQNLTWMDAVVGQVPVTPRIGAPVEINALWYSLLDQTIEFATRCQAADERIEELAKLRDHLGVSFVERFWQRDTGYLADVWHADGEGDVSVRPNMVIAASLRRSPLSSELRAQVVQRASEQLLTPRGLRTLTPTDPRYIGTYRGDQSSRDRAYHQGTVWPWLLGPYVEASLRCDASEERRSELYSLLQGFSEHFEEAGLAQVSEVFDGDAPHMAGGTPAQAWSVAELARALWMVEEPTCMS